MKRQRDWKMIRQGLDEYRLDYQQGTVDTYEGRLTYQPPEHWHAEDCPNKTIQFEPGRGYNGFRCPLCKLRFSLFMHLDKQGKVRDWSAHRQFDYSLEAYQRAEARLAARHPAEVNPMGDILSSALQANLAKSKAVENVLLLREVMEKLEKDLLGSGLFHAAMRELPALLAEARA